MKSYFLLPYSFSAQELKRAELSGLLGQAIWSKHLLYTFPLNDLTQGRIYTVRVDSNNWRLLLCGKTLDIVFTLFCAAKFYAYTVNSLVESGKITLIEYGVAKGIPAGEPGSPIPHFNTETEKNNFYSWHAVMVPGRIDLPALQAIANAFLKDKSILYASENLLASLEAFRGDRFYKLDRKRKSSPRRMRQSIFTSLDEMNIRTTQELSFLAAYRSIECITKTPYIKKDQVKNIISKNTNNLHIPDKIKLLYPVSRRHVVTSIEWIEHLTDLRNIKAGHSNLDAPHEISPYILTDLQRFIGNWIIQLCGLGPEDGKTERLSKRVSQRPPNPTA